VLERSGMTISPDLFHHRRLKQQNTQQFNLQQALMFMFRAVYSADVRQQVMAVHCHVLQFDICLLNRPLSSHAAQAIQMEVPFTSTIQIMAKVFYIKYVVVIVSQHTQAVIRMASLRTYLYKVAVVSKITSIIHQFHIV
jgi:hypothetical protein